MVLGLATISRKSSFIQLKQQNLEKSIRFKQKYSRQDVYRTGKHFIESKFWQQHFLILFLSLYTIINAGKDQS